jgi:hypothetical protein
MHVDDTVIFPIAVNLEFHGCIWSFLSEVCHIRITLVLHVSPYGGHKLLDPSS